MTAQENEEFLPKEHLDLPKEPLDLPAGRQDLPSPEASQTNPGYSSEIKTLISWTAPGRPFRQRTKQYYLTSLLLMLLIEIILFLFSQFVLMAVVLSLVFVSFALATVPPHNFHYRISSEGITIEDHFYLWQELYDFYFKKIEGKDVLHVRTHGFPGVLIIPLGDLDQGHIKSVLLPNLPFREIVKPTFMEKSADWLTRNFPLENPKHIAS